MKKSIALLLCLCMLFTMFTACGKTVGTTEASTEAKAEGNEPAAEKTESVNDGDVIKIGVFQPLTGQNAAGGEYELRGIQLANKKYPTVLGKKVELVIVDNKSDAVEAATAAARLVEEDVDVVLGSWGSGLSMAGGPVFANAKIPAIGISCTSANVTIGNDYYFRVCFVEDFKAKASARYLWEEGYETCAIIQDIAIDASVGVKKYFIEEYTALGGAIVSEVSYSMGDQDFNSQLMAVAAVEPDCVYLVGDYTESALIIKQARVLGYDFPFNGGDGLDVPPFTEIGGTDVDGTTFVTFFDANAGLTAETDAFVVAFRAAYPDEEPSALSALGYDAYLAAINAIENCGSTDGETLRDAIASMTFEGCSGEISFDKNGDAIKNAGVMKIVENGVSKFYKAVYMD